MIPVPSTLSLRVLSGALLPGSAALDSSCAHSCSPSCPDHSRLLSGSRCPTRKWKPGEEKAPPRLCRELLAQDPPDRRPDPFHTQGAESITNTKKETTGGFALVQKGYKTIREEGFPGRPCPPSPPGEHPSQGPLPPASAHTQCQCVRTYARSPPWEPATSLCQRPLILPMWLRLSETEGGSGEDREE